MVCWDLLVKDQIFAKTLCNLAVAICDHHGVVVPNKEEDLEQLPGVDFQAIQLILRHVVDRNLVIYYAGLFISQ